MSHHVDTVEAGQAIELSTGHTVTLPLSTTATIAGVTLGASRDAVDAVLPEGLKPVSVCPSRAAVTLMSVEYHRIGDSGIEPYDEFAVMFPAVPDDGQRWPLSAFSGGLGGYVWHLPVTTEPARALGDVWGYPKVVADIDIVEDGRWRRTTVDIDGQRLLSLDVERPRTFTATVSTRSYTSTDESLVRQPLVLRGDFGIAPLSRKFSLSIGTHPDADTLSALDTGTRALGRFGFEGEFWLRPPESID